MTPSEIADWLSNRAEEALQSHENIDFVNLHNAAATIRELEAGRIKWEAGDGLDGSVIHAVREVLNRANVPTMAFIDDHVTLLVHQRDKAIEALKITTEALERFDSAYVIEPNGAIIGLERWHLEGVKQALARIKEVGDVLR